MEVHHRKPFDTHDRVQLVCTQPTLTKQSMREECDINAMMAKWQKGAVLPVNPLPASYGDFSQALTYDQSLIQIEEAQALFDALPSSIRNEMDNDPMKLINFIANPENREEAERLHLVEKPKTAPPVAENPEVAPVAPIPETPAP